MEKKIVDSKYVDVVFEGGQLKVVIDAKVAVLELVKPALVSLKAKIPGTIDDAIIDRIIKEIEEA